MKTTVHIISCGLLLTLLLAGGCATLPENYDRPITYAYADTDRLDSIDRIVNIATGHRYSDSVLSNSRCWQDILIQ